MAWKEEWLAALVILLVASSMSLLFWDIRRAGGVAAWALGVVPVMDAFGEFFDRRSKRLTGRRRHRLRERQRRREIRKSGRDSRNRGDGSQRHETGNEDTRVVSGADGGGAIAKRA
jgi:hypothetical protein